MKIMEKKFNFFPLHYVKLATSVNFVCVLCVFLRLCLFFKRVCSKLAITGSTVMAAKFSSLQLFFIILNYIQW